jgi:creatinine amidohydrolase
VTFLPIQTAGHSEEHQRFPGTLTLSAATVIQTWTEIGESVRRAGLRKLVLITSHGGNVQAMDIVARDLRARYDMLVVSCGWHRFGYPNELFTPEERKHGIHAGDIETSLMLAAREHIVRKDKTENFVPATIALGEEFRWLNAHRPASFGWMTQDLHPSGALGDASAATAAKGDTALEHGARAFVELLGEVARFDLAGLRKGPLG